jgi:hypothetical protein
VIGGDRDLVQIDDAVLDKRTLLAVLIEDDRRGRRDQRQRFARDLSLDSAIDLLTAGRRPD